MRISSCVFSRKIHRNVLAKIGFHKTLFPKKLCMYVFVCCCESRMLDSQQQKQKFTTLSFSCLFPIDGILSTPPNTLVIHYWTGDVGGERWYCNQRKKERKFHGLLLLLNPKSPNKKFKFSLLYGCPETRREKKNTKPHITQNNPVSTPPKKKNKLQ